MPLYKMETKSHFTFLQGINSGIIIIIDKNLFDTYLVDKTTQIKKLGNKWGCCTQRQNLSKLSPLARGNWGYKWGCYTQTQNFSKLSPLANSNWDHKWGPYTKRQNFSKLSPFAKVTEIISGVITPKD